MKDLDKAFKDMKNKMDGFVNSKLMKKLSKQGAASVTLRTRLGKGVAKNGAYESSLKKLSKSYKKLRSRSELSSGTTASKSNLTFTGKLLKSIKGKSISKKQGVIYLTDDREGKVSNNEIAGYQERAGRVFMRLSFAEINALKKTIVEELMKTIKRSLS